MFEARNTSLRASWLYSVCIVRIVRIYSFVRIVRIYSTVRIVLLYVCILHAWPLVRALPHPRPSPVKPTRPIPSVLPHGREWARRRKYVRTPPSSRHTGPLVPAHTSKGQREQHEVVVKSDPITYLLLYPQPAHSNPRCAQETSGRTIHRTNAARKPKHPHPDRNPYISHS